MSLLSEILDHNRSFVESRAYEPLLTDRFPNKKLVVLTCMDTRLIELLPLAMNLRQGDAKILKTAGAVISHPFGSVMRSILVAVYELGAAEVAVVGHQGCGMMGLSCGRILDKAKARGISDEVVATLHHAGIDLQRWLSGFESVEAGVRSSVDVIRNHPLLPDDIPVHGMLMDSETGKIELLIDGYGTVAKQPACGSPAQP